MLVSHRVLRYAAPFLHVVALLASAVLAATSTAYAVALALQVGLLVAAMLAGTVRFKPLLVARYYVLTTASVAAGLWDWLRHGTSAGWEPVQETR